MKKFFPPLTLAMLALCAIAARQGFGPGNAPIIPGTSWQVHDEKRPAPRVVTPGATFSQLAPPPSDAIVLFDGKDLSKWQNPDGSPASWKISDGYFESPATPAGATHDMRTKDTFPDFQLHLEFATPAEVKGTGQNRGNSGLMINGLYEVQILDSFNNPTYPDGQAGALYGQKPPLVNASKPPGEWQSYDIIFESPRWDEKGVLTKKAAVTVIQNGVVLHHKLDYIGRTDGIGGLPNYSLGSYGDPHAPEVFLALQDHREPVRFRNIWIRPLGNYDQPLPAAASTPSANITTQTTAN
jgi:hypothetical protein